MNTQLTRSSGGRRKKGCVEDQPEATSLCRNHRPEHAGRKSSSSSSKFEKMTTRTRTNMETARWFLQSKAALSARERPLAGRFPDDCVVHEHGPIFLWHAKEVWLSFNRRRAGWVYNRVRQPRQAQCGKMPGPAASRWGRVCDLLRFVSSRQGAAQIKTARGNEAGYHANNQGLIGGTLERV